MRILSISNTPLNPDQGSGYVITGFVRGLRERDHDVEAYGPSDWGWVDVPRGRRYVYPLFIAVFGLWHYRPRNYDLIELWGGTTWLLAVCLRWMYEDLPLVHHSNGIEQHRVEVQKRASTKAIQNRFWFQWDMSPLHNLGLHASDAIVTVGAYDLSFLKERQFVPEDRLYAINNPLPDLFLDRDVQYERPNRIGFCGTWSAVKAPPVLVGDMTTFLRTHPEWMFSLVGVGEVDVSRQFPGDVRQQIETTSFLEREKLIEWYHDLAIFTLPSIYESFGLVLAEAMACGVAIVATNVGFAFELDHQEEAFILPEPESPHLKNALSALVKNESLRRKIARAGYERVQHLRWEDAVDRLEAIYETLISDASPAA